MKHSQKHQNNGNDQRINLNISPVYQRDYQKITTMLNAMIFAAGLGTRLMPLTAHVPKALVDLNGQPLLWYALQNVIQAGATRVVVNVHHFPDQITDYLSKQTFPGVEIVISDETDELLETGGGLLKALPLFVPDNPILIHNADVITNCNLSELVSTHRQSDALATLMVQARNTERYLLFDENNRLAGWQNTKTGECLMTTNPLSTVPLAFNGIQIVNYDICHQLGETRKFSITNGYLSLAANHHIMAWKNWKGQWFDIGTIEKRQMAEHEFTYHSQ